MKLLELFVGKTPAEGLDGSKTAAQKVVANGVIEAISFHSDLFHLEADGTISAQTVQQILTFIENDPDARSGALRRTEFLGAWLKPKANVDGKYVY